MGIVNANVGHGFGSVKTFFIVEALSWRARMHAAALTIAMHGTVHSGLHTKTAVDRAVIAHSVALAHLGRIAMNEDDIATAEVHAHRMLGAMQAANHALSYHGLDDRNALQRQHAPGTELHDAICAFVKHLKSAGLPSEEVVVLAKRSVVQLERLLPGTANRALMERVISMCIQEYYRT